MDFCCLPCQRPAQPTLVRLVVTNATHLTGDEYWASLSGALDFQVRAVTSPDNAPTWQDLQWTNGVAGIADNLHTSPRTPVGTVTITAALGALLGQQVQLHVYDVTAVACDLPLNPALNSWKGYLGQGYANLTATTNPNTAVVHKLLRWTGGSWAWPWDPDERRQVSLTSAANHNVRVTLGGRHIDCTVRICQWPALRVNELTFSGGFALENDTLGPFDLQWLRTRSQANQPPVGYRRNRSITLEGELGVTTRPTDAETVDIRARGTFGGANLSWTWANVAVGNAVDTVDLGQVASVPALPDQVAVYDPVELTWEMRDPAGHWSGGNWTRFGTTRHLVYAVLEDPDVNVTTHWTLLDVSCRAAAGQNTAAGVVAAVFAPFQALNVSRKRDGKRLRYWNPDTTDATDTQGLLQRADGSGQCGAWAELLVDMYRVHGIARGHKVYVAHTTKINHVFNGVVPPVMYGFLVKNWEFRHPPASSAAALTHRKGENCVRRPGIPGHYNPNPPPQFGNHFIVVDDPTGTLYDPSYGVSYGNPDAWEAAAVAGLYTRAAAPAFNAGYDTALGPARRLVYRDRVTNGDL